MLKVSLTVLFEEPFWIGLYERSEAGCYEVCKITFGAQPKEYEVYEFLLRHGGHLRFSPALAGRCKAVRHQNPKRIQREIHRQLVNMGIGTKAQQALQMQREQNKQARKDVRRQQRGEERERQYQIRQEKKKAKHKGR